MNWDFLGFLATMVSIGVAITIPFGMFTIYRSLGRRLEGRAAPGAGEIAALEKRLIQLEEIVHASALPDATARLVELEERMDFAERLMTETTVPRQLGNSR